MVSNKNQNIVKVKDLEPYYASDNIDCYATNFKTLALVNLRRRISQIQKISDF